MLIDTSESVRAQPAETSAFQSSGEGTNEPKKVLRRKKEELKDEPKKEASHQWIKKEQVIKKGTVELRK